MCGDSGILLNAELCEGAEVEGEKAYVERWGKHTAATLRLTEPYHNLGKCLVADSWFGSYRNAAAHLEVGTYTIMNVKRNRARAPVKVLLDKCKKRGQHFTKIAIVNIRGKTLRLVFMTIHMDKKPMVLIHTMATTGKGAPRTRCRRKLVKGRNVYKRWTLKQPDVHAIYRGKFNMVDRFNGYAMGLRSI